MAGLPPVLEELRRLDRRIDNLDTSSPGSGDAWPKRQGISLPGEIDGARAPDDIWWPKTNIKLVSIEAGQRVAPSSVATTYELLKNNVAVIATITVPIGATRTAIQNITPEPIILTSDYLSIRIVDGSGNNGRVFFDYDQA